MTPGATRRPGRPRQRLGLLLTAVVAGTLLVGLPASPAGATAPVSASRVDDVPEVGDCHEIDLREAGHFSDPDRPLPCERHHTSRTYLVTEVPAGVEMDDVEALQGVVGRRCGSAWATTLSTSRARRVLSAYSYVWFGPTKAQVEAGARWLRCDLVLVGGSSFAPLPPARTPQLGAPPHPDVEARCYRSRQYGYDITTCSRPHAYRAKGVYAMSGRAYPTDARRQQVAEQRCPRIAGTTRQWAVFNPSPEQWRQGFRLFVCTRITKS